MITIKIDVSKKQGIAFLKYAEQLDFVVVEKPKTKQPTKKVLDSIAEFKSGKTFKVKSIKELISK